MKNNTTGLKHFLKAFGYSIDGFKWIIKKEAAFRHDILFAILVIAITSCATSFNLKKIAIVVASTFLLFIVELLNSAIECVVDIVSPEFNILAKAAKDMCSAAVFVAVVIVLFAMGVVIFL